MSENNNSDFLLKRIGDLERELAETRAESKKRRLEKKRLQADLDALKAARDALTSDLASWKEKAEADPDAWQVRYEDLARQVRARDHKDAWTAAIGRDLAEKVPVEKVWAELGYQPGAELPTPAEIVEQAGRARDAAPYLFKPASAPEATASRDATQAPRARLTVGMDAGRGDRVTGTEKLYVRESQLKDPRFTLPHTRALAEASRTGNLVVLPG